MCRFISPTDPFGGFVFLCVVQLEDLKEKNRLAKQKERAQKRKKGKEESGEDTRAKKKKVKKVIFVTFVGKDKSEVSSTLL